MTYQELLENRAQISHLCIYDLKKNTVSVLHTFPHVIEAPQWCADHRTLLYNAQGKICRYDMKDDTSQVIPTGDADTCNNDHVLSPDGKRLGISSGSHGDLSSRIYIADLCTGSVRCAVETSPSYFHGWSPDGKMLVYCAMRDDNPTGGDIYTAPAEGGAEKRLTFSEGLNDGPEYSPDGKTIWFHSVRTGLMQIWRMNADGSEQSQAAFDKDANSWFPHISPDGKKVVYIAYHRGDVEPGQHLPDKNVEIRYMNVDGTGKKTLVSLFGGQGTINVNSWSPDSSAFAFVSYEKGV